MPECDPAGVASGDVAHAPGAAGEGAGLPETAASVCIHLGAHKTASTHLQQAIRAHRRALLGVGVQFFGPPHFRSAQFRFREVMAARGGIAALRRRRAPGLVARCRAARRVAMSEENILGGAHDADMLAAARFYPRAQERLARFMAATGTGETALLLAVRDPASFLLSAYSQKLLGGRPIPFDSFIGELEPARLRWSELVARLCAVPGVRGCIVWRYEDYPAVAPEVLRAFLGTAGAERVTLPQARAHEGLSARAQAEVMRWLRGGGRGDAARAVRRARARHPKSPDAPAFAPFDAATLAASAAAYNADLERVAAQPGVRIMRP